METQQEGDLLKLSTIKSLADGIAALFSHPLRLPFMMPEAVKSLIWQTIYLSGKLAMMLVLKSWKDLRRLLALMKSSTGTGEKCVLSVSGYRKRSVLDMFFASISARLFLKMRRMRSISFCR